MRAEKKLTLLFYTTGSILFSLPILFYSITGFKNIFLNNILLLFKPNFEAKTLFLMLFLTFIIIIYDLFFLKNEKQIKKNILLFETVFGKHNDIRFNFFISLLSGYMEELIFRGYIYLLLITLFKEIMTSVIYLDAVFIIIISLVFALFHIIQGKTALYASFIISIVFFISIKMSDTILYAIGTHALINFLELSIVVPYQKKRITSEFE